MSSVYAFQWLLNFAITRSTPYMMLNLDKWGAYLIFSLFTFCSVGKKPFPRGKLQSKAVMSLISILANIFR